MCTPLKQGIILPYTMETDGPESSLGIPPGRLGSRGVDHPYHSILAQASAVVDVE